MANEEDLRLITQLSEEKYAWYMLGLSVSRLFAHIRARGTEDDLAFGRELARRLYEQCEGDEQRIAKFRGWIEQGFF